MTEKKKRAIDALAAEKLVTRAIAKVNRFETMVSKYIRNCETDGTLERSGGHRKFKRATNYQRRISYTTWGKSNSKILGTRYFES